MSQQTVVWPRQYILQDPSQRPADPLSCCGGSAGDPPPSGCVQVNLKLFTPAPHKRRTVLLFVFRDRTRTPLARLIETWEEDLRQMWASITKPPDYEGCDITDFFEVCTRPPLGCT